MIMEIEQQPRPVSDGPSSPFDLRTTRQLRADLDIGRFGGRQLAYDLASDRQAKLHRRPRRREQPLQPQHV